MKRFSISPQSMPWLSMAGLVGLIAATGTVVADTIVVDDQSSQAEQLGDWSASSHSRGYQGAGYLHDGNADKGDKSVAYRAQLAPGNYAVTLNWAPHDNRASNVPVTVHHAQGSTTLSVDMRQAPTNGGGALGTFTFDAHATVVVGTAGTDGYVIADAVTFSSDGVPQPEVAQPAAPAAEAPAELITLDTDDSAVELVGNWPSSDHEKGFAGDGYLHDDNRDKGAKSVTYRPSLAAGEYAVLLNWTAHANRASNVPVTVQHANGSAAHRVNMTQRPDAEGHLLGTYTLGDGAAITIGTAGTDGYVIADAVTLLRLGDLPGDGGGDGSAPAPSPDPAPAPDPVADGGDDTSGDDVSDEPVTGDDPVADGGETPDDPSAGDEPVAGDDPVADPDPETPVVDANDEAILAKGLELVRKEGLITNGAACVNCHAPDMIDLAYFNFSRENIIRRATPHLSEEEAVQIADYVEALRRKYNIEQPKDPMKDRPLQPGGFVLPGDTPPERDLAFGKQLQDMGVLLATQPVLNIDDAFDMMEDLITINPRTLPVGIPFNRWSEDHFHGTEHATVADWLPDMPVLPNDPQKLLALHDAYLENPTAENLAAIMDNDLFPSYGYFKDYAIEVFSDRKYKSVLVAQHLFRQEVTGGEVLADQEKAVAFMDFPYTSIWDVGDKTRADIGKAFDPDEAGLSQRVHVNDEWHKVMRHEMQKMTSRWFWAGWLFDLSLHNTSGSGETINAGYFGNRLNEDWDAPSANWLAGESRDAWRDAWEAYGKGGLGIHAAFMNSFRVMVVNFDHTAHDNVARVGGEFKGTTRWEAGEFYSKMGGFGSYYRDWKRRPLDEPRWEIYELMTENLYRSVLLFEIELAEQTGEPIAGTSVDSSIAHFLIQNTTSEHYNRNMEILERWLELGE